MLHVRPLEKDSRMFLWMMAAEGVEATGRMLARWSERCSYRGRLDAQLRRFRKLGWVTRTEGPTDARIYALTEQGRRCIWGELDPAERWGRTWDGNWRVAMFDVPQAKVALRTRLRRKLSELKFGWLQNSVWVSPDRIDELARQLEQRAVSVESLLFIEGRPAAGESDADLVAAAWDFRRLANLHSSYLKLLRMRPTAARTKLADWTTWAETEDRAWREIVRLDPFLPSDLLPSDYAGRTVWEARHEALLAGAEAIAAAVSRD